ncbi:uncharacterized protein L969DRAFT_83860 [Mixia osmundae IAM 14324]|uniref:Uncharacterized protein n=1 Tax=Mixia osmundae (strain CBS 9802 / IAM 14324 / JCM 22182 / KY 12970) TaxID=764103 RepID=G7E400_MIXOS|nr:uncharacterized protein L969DRAFT_83860 [Mixia osmundae IAM 14324]KEI42006.1 hypothetical protein L969DRAFT_83860 [Mixia osmundae IAM 14324]GAA97560.1 hypothetical protein E5Q_04238 [Mixia osmundae IAM 14324]
MSTTNYLVSGTSAASLQNRDDVGHASEVWCLNWSKSGLVASGSCDGTLKTWNPSDPNVPLRTFAPNPSTEQSRSLGIVSVDLEHSPTSPSFLVTSAVHSVLRRYNVKTGDLQASKSIPSAGAWQVSLHPDITLDQMVTAGTGCKVRILDSKSDTFGTELAATTCRGKFAMCVSYSPDGRLIATASDTGQVDLLDVQTMRIVQSFPAHATAIRSLAFSPDSSLLVTGSDDHRMSIIDLRASQSGDNARKSRQSVVSSLAGHAGWVTSVSIKSDARLLASGSVDGTIKIWDLHMPGSALTTIQDQKRDVWALAWRPDPPQPDAQVQGISGSRLGGGNFVSGGADGALRWYRSAGS